jgi:lactoylglutathione lyase
VIRSAFPIVSTPDLDGALRFYRDLLGGTVTYQFPAEGAPGYVALDLGSSHLGLGLDPEAREGSQGQRFSLWLYADDCDETVTALRTGGATVTEEPTDQPWGERVARVLDPDGNEVIVGSPPS